MFMLCSDCSGPFRSTPEEAKRDGLYVMQILRDAKRKEEQAAKGDQAFQHGKVTDFQCQLHFSLCGISTSQLHACMFSIRLCNGLLMTQDPALHQHVLSSMES